MIDAILNFLGTSWVMMSIASAICIGIFLFLKKPTQKVLKKISKQHKESEHLQREEDTRRIAQALIATLVDKNIEVLSHELKALIGMGESAVEPLIFALKHSNAKVRWIAARALGEIKDLRAIEPLIKASVDQDSLVRLTVTNILGAIDDVRVIEALTDRLNDKDYLVSRSALKPFAEGKIKHSLAVDPIVKFLNDKDPQVCRDAIKALGKLGNPKVLIHLIPLLNTADPETQEQLIWTLKEINDPAALEPLSEILINHKLPRLRAEAAKALGKLGDRNVLNLLRTTLEKETDEEVKKALLQAIRELSVGL